MGLYDLITDHLNNLLTPTLDDHGQITMFQQKILNSGALNKYCKQKQLVSIPINVVRHCLHVNLKTVLWNLKYLPQTPLSVHSQRLKQPRKNNFPLFRSKLLSDYKVLSKNAPRFRPEMSKFFPERTPLYLLASIARFQIGTKIEPLRFTISFQGFSLTVE